MVKLKYSRPLTAEALPELAEKMSLLEARLKRRRVISVICGWLCFLFHTAMMSFSAISLYAHQAGPDYVALMDRVPQLAEADAFVFQELPARFGLTFAIPQLLGVGAAILLPALICLVVSLLLRLAIRARGKTQLPPEASEDERLALLRSEAEALAEKSKPSRKANWTLRSAFLSLLLSGGAIAWSLYVIRPDSEDLDAAYFSSYVFIALILFTALFVAAYVTDSLTALLCALDTQWDGDTLKDDLLALEESRLPAPEEPSAEGDSV